ncbi:hypothetical protein ACOBQJ_00680 [Pelotomaculum propionicicum]|uniref:hypothetical protein n=1 Tax=Pelotomaculum propionicicum TaxID=258475 RepID=UPI003B7F4644
MYDLSHWTMEELAKALSEPTDELSKKAEQTLWPTVWRDMPKKEKKYLFLLLRSFITPIDFLEDYHFDMAAVFLANIFFAPGHSFDVKQAYPVAQGMQ